MPCSQGEHCISTIRMGNVVLALPSARATCAWVLAHLGETTEALSMIREGRRLLNVRQPEESSATAAGWTTRWGVPACFSASSTKRSAWLSLPSKRLSLTQDSPPLRYTCSATSQPIQIDSTPRTLKLTHYRKALALAEPRGMRPLAAHCHLGLGRLHRRTGKHQEVHECLATATTMYRDMGMTYWLQKAEADSPQ
jgi:hypothetical protein